MPELLFTLNGERIELQVDGVESLAEVLRERLNQIGTKLGCNEGECGTCTVLLDQVPVNSCILPAMKAHNNSVVTIEGIREHPISKTLQKAFVDVGAVQCGYCTPGFLISSFALLKKRPTPPVAEIHRALEGNLCRCTGYRKIVAGIQLAAKLSRTSEDN